MAATLDFGDGSWEDARGVVQTTLNELNQAVKGNGRAGMQSQLTILQATIDTREEERQRFETRALWLLGFLLSVVLAGLTGLGLWLNSMENRHKFGQVDQAVQSPITAEVPAVHK